MSKITISQEEKELLARIKKQPELRGRFEQILSIAESECEGCMTADQAEARVTEELRKLGNEVLHGWAKSKHDQIEKKLKEKELDLKLREKKIS